MSSYITYYLVSQGASNQNHQQFQWHLFYTTPYARTGGYVVYSISGKIIYLTLTIITK